MVKRKSLKEQLGISRKGVIVKGFKTKEELIKFENNLIFNKKHKGMWQIQTLRNGKKYVLVAE